MLLRTSRFRAATAVACWHTTNHCCRCCARQAALHHACSRLRSAGEKAVHKRTQVELVGVAVPLESLTHTLQQATGRGSRAHSLQPPQGGGTD